MDGEPFVYLDVDEYERIRDTDLKPESVCLAVHGYWVQIVPKLVYELEYRGLMTPDEQMSTYILTRLDADGKLIS